MSNRWAGFTERERDVIREALEVYIDTDDEECKADPWTKDAEAVLDSLDEFKEES